MKKILTLSVFVLATIAAFAQKDYLTRTGHVSFFSKAPLENIEANNHQATALLKTATGKLAYKIPIKSFEFEKALMQEHFNENYMESDKYSEASFDGTIDDISKVDFTKSGTYKVSVTGKLTIHGVTKQITVPGEIVVDTAKKKVTTNATFTIALADYGIKNDKVKNISENIEIRVKTELSEK